MTEIARRALLHGAGALGATALAAPALAASDKERVLRFMPQIWCSSIRTTA
jgi:hypothetical protein